jgi:hypothetical protein
MERFMSRIDSEISWEAVLVTPEMAKAWLSAESIRISDFPHKDLESYIKEMKSNRWEINGEAIIFSTTNDILDGKKRLAACAAGGVAFPTLTLRGIDRNAASTIDDHRKRRAADILYVGGQDDAAIMSTVASNIVAIATRVANAPAISGAAISRFSEFDSDFMSVIKDSKTMKSSMWGTRAMVAACMYLFLKSDREKARNFFSSLENEETIGTFKALRLAWSNMTNKGSRKEARFVAAYLVKAWNSFYDGVELTRFIWQVETGEQFPAIAGLPEDLLLPNVMREEKAGQKDYATDLHSNVVSLSVELVTPKLATELLMANGPSQSGRNRRLSESVAKRYARDMSEGRWQLNGQGIKISAGGRILDGQHRLKAIILSGKTIRTVIIRGLSDDVFTTLDQGKKKGINQALQSSGLSHWTSLAAAASHYWHITVGGSNYIDVPTTSELQEVVEQNPLLLESVKYSTRSSMRALGSQTLLAAVHYITTSKNPEKGAEFFEHLSTGAGLESKNPILDLRNRMMNDRNNKRSKSIERTKLGWIVTSWNAWRSGKTVHGFRVLETIPDFAD